MTVRFQQVFAALALTCAMLQSGVTFAADDHVVSLAEGKVTLTAPADWKFVKPRVNIIDAEYSVPAAEGDDAPGRVTVMGAGGSVEANIDRWLGQFIQADGAATRNRAKIEKEKIAGVEVHLVDIPGTFRDQRGPFAPAVERENYRMLAAIIPTEKLGQYFVKLTGPEKTVAANEKAFRSMIESLKVK